MTIQTPVSTIQLDKLTRAQFDALSTKDQTHLYVITDESTDGLPDQTGHSGHYLTTNGTSASWSTVDTLPSQSGNTGKFLTTNGTTASWATIAALQNTATANTSSLTICGNGTSSTVSVNIGFDSSANDNGTTVIGYFASASGTTSTAIGYNANTSATGAIQLGKGTNSNAGTLSVGLSADASTWNNYQLLNSSGLIPAERLTNALPEQSGNSGKFLTTNGTAASWAAAIENKATGNVSITILGANSTKANSINIGSLSEAGTSSVAIGNSAKAYISYNHGVALGANAIAQKTGSIQIGMGTNSDAGTMCIGLTTDGTNSTNYQILDSSGNIPAARLTNALPAQSEQSGKFLTTNGTTASWTTISALQNTATGSNSLTIGGTATSQSNATNVGISSAASGSMSTAYGYLATASGSTSIAIGRMVYATQSNAIAIGNMAHSYGDSGIAIGVQAEAGSSTTGAIQIGPGTNSNTATLSIGLYNGSTSNNYQLLNASGNIPHQRMGDAIQLVSQLPASPVAGVLYLIPE